VSEERRSLTPPRLAEDAHKGTAGCVLSLCGSREMPGAAVLVARGAIRAGAGLVTAGCLDVNLMGVLPVAVPEVVLKDLTRLSDLPFLLETGDFHAVVAGPGTGTSGRGAELARHLLHAGLTCPLVLDADALNNLAGEPEAMRGHAGPLVITPHPGEARRLLGAEVPADGAGRVRCARELSERTGAIVCLKGAGTVVAHGTTVYVNDTGNPGMATAGAGDVLTGVLGAYLALCATGDHPDWTPFDAACAAVRAHGFAGDLAAAHLGQRALVATDLVTWLAGAQKRLEE
jgi:NAD(P)H-hydrate epimerase